MNPHKIDNNIIFVDENIPLLADALKPCGIINNFRGRELTNKNLKENGCNALFVRSTTKLNQALLDGTDVKFAGTSTSGIDHVDTEYLKKEKIYFAYAPGSNANSVAEYVVYSILKWQKLTNSDLKNKTIGIIGYGNIGKIAANYVNYMGLKVFVNDPPLKDSGFSFPDFTKYAELDELCSKSNVITSHVPLTSEGKYKTFHLFNKNNIRLIKNGSLFIHTSRGGLAEEEPLLKRLTNNEIQAAIDVWENEPLINAKLAKAAMLATPHVAGYSREGKLRGAKMLAESFRIYTRLEPDLSEIERELSSYHPMPVEKYMDYDKLFNLLRESRNIDEDTINLLATLELHDSSRIAEFDLLRKNYLLRREIL